MHSDKCQTVSDVYEVAHETKLEIPYPQLAPAGAAIPAAISCSFRAEASPDCGILADLGIFHVHRPAMPAMD